jgi:hypothetical protein
MKAGARRFQAKLSIKSAPGDGTEIALNVAARLRTCARAAHHFTVSLKSPVGSMS